MKELIVKGSKIKMKDGYFSLTDIARQTDRAPNDLIREWLRNQSTLQFLEEWEIANNSKHGEFPMFKLEDLQRSRGITIKRYIERGGLGIKSASGRYGGTYAQVEIALEFAAWVNPRFKVWFFKEWVRMKEVEMKQGGLQWTLDKVINNSMENTILLESIKQQLKDNNLL